MPIKQREKGGKRAPANKQKFINPQFKFFILKTLNL